MKIALFCILLVALAMFAVPSWAAPGSPKKGNTIGTPFKEAKPQPLPSPSHYAWPRGDTPPRRELNQGTVETLKNHFSQTIQHNGHGESPIGGFKSV
ncbi:Retinoic acid receptor RXR-gamma [Frankliniella fusca]|uniref:Retinoic acid receptor RXR-gamma n=1 Tax=Frankliniella fusca TaxID=407009 RepID=A0AAE1H5C6_9NEOP|nr:Retinoic acid receptor RXR-gamma [Frankliniella fusca]